MLARVIRNVNRSTASLSAGGDSRAFSALDKMGWSTPIDRPPVLRGKVSGMTRQQCIRFYAGLFAVIGVGLFSASLARAQRSRPSSAKNTSQRKLLPRQIAERTGPSVVLLLTADEGGNPIALGSGFFVANDRIVTNYHVIKDASQIFVRIAGRKRLYKISFPGLPDEQSDLALLRIDEVKGQPLKLGNLSRLRVGDEIYVMGNPEGLEGTFSRGNVSAIRSGKGLIQITAPIYHGSSGGPVLDERGEVIGVAAGIFSEGQNLNFAIPVSKLAPMLKPENDLLAGMAADSATSPSVTKEPVPEWQPVASGSGEDHFISRIMATPEHTFIAWIKVVPADSPEGRAFHQRIIDELNKRRVDRSSAFSYLMQQWEFDCGHQKYRSLKEVHYDHEGVPLYDLDPPTTRWDAVFPDSFGEAWLNFVCKGK